MTMPVSTKKISYFSLEMFFSMMTFAC